MPGLFESLFGFDLFGEAQANFDRNQQTMNGWYAQQQQQAAQAAQNAARQQAEYERQCEIFRRNQEAQGIIIEGECRIIEDVAEEQQKLLPNSLDKET